MNLPLSSAVASGQILPPSLAGLIGTLEHAGPADAAHAAELLSDLVIDSADLHPWHDFSHPVHDSYGRLLVQGGANYELMVMSWAPGDYSAIHDHGVAEWGAVRYFGAADHVVFDEGTHLLSIEQRMTMAVDDVFAVDHSLIHLMGNPTDRPFVSLHLYGRAQPAESITGSARIFELYENRIQRTDGGVFFCLPENEIRHRESCPEADPTTRLLHHQLMLARLARIAECTELDPELTIREVKLRSAISALSDQIAAGVSA